MLDAIILLLGSAIVLGPPISLLAVKERPS